MVDERNASIAIREVDSFEAIDACVDLQRMVWQVSDRDLMPRRNMVVTRATGGYVLGAWDGKRLIGFALAVAGIRDGRPYWHSHMLAVAPEYRNRGIAARLKWAQRDAALARGLERIEWTFDPFQVKNAHFNIEKLGAIVRRYTPDFYGVSGSPLDASRPTDRLHAEWWLRSQRVEERLAGHRLPDVPIRETIAIPEGAEERSHPRPESCMPDLELCLHVRRQFLDAFARGLVVLQFQTEPGRDAQYGLGIEGGEPHAE